MKLQKITLIKLGGSVITDKSIPYKANTEVIREIAKSLKRVKTPLLLGHGVGSFAHTSAKKYGGKDGYKSKWGIAKVARDAQEINRIVMDIFIEEGLPAISFSPRSFLLTEKGSLKSSHVSPIIEALKQDLIPVVYGDVLWDTSQKTTIFSGETILNVICRNLLQQNYNVSKIIQLCNVDGVLDAEKKVIAEITKSNWLEVKAYIEKVKVTDVTGGMEHKVEQALMMADNGIPTMIINGDTKDDLMKAMFGRQIKGTLIA